MATSTQYHSDQEDPGDDSQITANHTSFRWIQFVAAFGGVVASFICCVSLCIFTVQRVKSNRESDLHTDTSTVTDRVPMQMVDTEVVVQRGPGMTILSTVIANSGSPTHLEESALIADIEGKGAHSVSIVSRAANPSFIVSGTYTEYAEGMET